MYSYFCGFIDGETKVIFYVTRLIRGKVGRLVYEFRS